MVRPVDLRSDTVTKPSEAMRRAMAEAEVGDDWYGDDPTVNRLQERAAEITGTEASLYVATGTMANQIALHVQTRPGHVVVCEEGNHVATTEITTSAMLSGIGFKRIASERGDGRVTAAQVAEALDPDPYDVEIVDLVSLENTHQVGGGTVTPADEVRAVAKVARDMGVRVHLDGARLFNAAAAAGTPVAEFAAEVDSLMFCLSKGLGAPIGSVICGDAAFIREARRDRILLGGAWRQAGIMAAAGLVALDEGPARLHEDHERARRLAEGIAEVDPAFVDPAAVETNILFLETGPLGMRPWDVVLRLRDAGVLSNTVGGRVRFVTHLGVTDEDVEETIRVWRQIAAEARKG